MQFGVLNLLLLSASFSTWLVWDISQFEPEPEVPEVPPSEVNESTEHPLVLKWRADDALFDQCFESYLPARGGVTMECGGMNIADFDWETTRLSECLQCSGWYDLERTGACEVKCDLSGQPYTQTTPTGCICGDEVVTWSLEHCQMLLCQDYGFEATDGDSDFLWRLPDVR